MAIHLGHGRKVLGQKVLSFSANAAYWAGQKAWESAPEASKVISKAAWWTGKTACKAGWWTGKQVWHATSDTIKAPVRLVSSLVIAMAKVYAWIGAIGLGYIGIKKFAGGSLPVNSTGTAFLNYAVKPAITWAAPHAAAGLENVKETVREAVIETATDALNKGVPLAFNGILSLGIGIVSSAPRFLWGMATETWRVISGLDHQTKAQLASSLAIGLFAKYYAAPRIYKFCFGVPLPKWVWSGDAHQVTPLSRGLASLKKWIWKSKELEPVLNEDVRKRIETIVAANNNILKNGGYFKNLLLLGDPGIGKTMLVEKMARDSGFNFIKISGAEFAWRIPLGTAVSALNEVISFSRDSAYPTILVIDEIDAICPNPDAVKDARPSRAEKEFRSALLAAIGKSKKLLIVGTTNLETDIDPGMLSRLNNRVKMQLPDRDSRIKILTQNIDKYLGEIPERATCLNKESIEKLADRTEGMNGRTLFQFVDSLAMQRPVSAEQRLTEESIEEVLGFYIDDLKRDREAKEARAAKRAQEWGEKWGDTLKKRLMKEEASKTANEPLKVEEATAIAEESVVKKVEPLHKRISSWFSSSLTKLIELVSSVIRRFFGLFQSKSPEPKTTTSEKITPAIDLTPLTTVHNL